MKKKLFVPMLMTGALLFGGAVGASSTTLQNGAEGLKEMYRVEYNEWSDSIAHELGIYEEEKYVELENFSSEYFAQKKEGYMNNKKNQVDEEFDTKKQELKNHIDDMFK